jgi:transposase
VGIVLALKATTLRTQVGALLEDLPGWANTVIGDLLSEIHRLDERITAYDRHIAEMARQDHQAQQLMRLPGIGQTVATALVAMIGDGPDFCNGRQLSA